MAAIQLHGKTQAEPVTVRVLVVDDLAFMRMTISAYLKQRTGIEVVGCARDGEEALKMIPALNPDVVTLDVEMPRMDGLTTLQHIMARFPRPVIMLSSLTTEGAVETIRALTLGAVDFVAKPSEKANIQAVMDEAVRKILTATQAKVRPLNFPSVVPAAQAAPVMQEKQVRAWNRRQPVVLIGASTGGPRALNQIIPLLPGSLDAAVVVVQHMPAGFTRSLADRLNSISALYVKEAEPGEPLETGKVLLAQGGFHLTFNELGQSVLTQTPPVHGVRPAVDVTLSSLVQRYQRGVIAVILTGMGRDGSTGAVLLHDLGGWVIAEHEFSCVVWGMPRSVVEAGAARVIAPLDAIPNQIIQAVSAYRP